MDPSMNEVSSLLAELAGTAARALALGPVGGVVLARVLTIGGVVLLGCAGYRALTGLIERLLRPAEGSRDYAVRAQRARTLAPLMSNTACYLIAFAVSVVVLQQLGIDVRALVVSAGVVGLAISLGAQGVIKDVLTGFFLLFENLVAVGDVIEVGTHVGVVESVGLRITRVRKFSGELRIVPNSELTAFGHHTAGWARAVVEVGVGRDQDVEQALRVLGDVGRAFREAHQGQVLDAPEAEGILRFGLREVVLRVHARVDAASRDGLERELRLRVKEALEAEGIWASHRRKESAA